MLISSIGLLEPIQNQDHRIIPDCSGDLYRFIHTKCPLSLIPGKPKWVQTRCKHPANRLQTDFGRRDTVDIASSIDLYGTIEVEGRLKMTQQQPVETVGEIRQRARRDAAQLLESYWGEGLPVDPVTLARRAGASVFTAQLGEDTYGMIVGSGTTADIYVDKDQPFTRFRFTTAHELGHYIDHSLRGSGLAKAEGYVDKRSDKGRGTAPEIYANEFAASVLMPEEEIRRDAKTHESLFEMAKKYAVSVAAMSWRLRHLGIELGQG